jgi:peptidoglycan/xylan/chitin deacetylase (PgdA/CDA1 family)
VPPTETAATPTPPIEPTPDGLVRTTKVPILMYHYISTPPADADAYRTDLSITPELLSEQLDRLVADGYTTISLYQLLEYLTKGVPLPEKPVVLTFDDGYRDNYENAFPLLRKRGMTATFFVITDFIDEQRPLYLSWDMAREMLAAGMSIESHGRNHFTLEGQDDDYLVWQALGSMETLQHELGVRPRFVSYPAGDHDQRTIDIFHSANYWGGLTTEQGTQQYSEHPFELERIRMRNTTTPDDLIRYMEADW